MTRPVIIDTDPGIDDAIAILYALAAPGLDVRAITTVAGNLGLAVTTRNALRILALAGRDVPVIAGAAAPLARPGVAEAAIHGDDGLGGVAFPDPAGPAVRSDASRFLAEVLLAHPPGHFDILALAPLTNLALLVRQAPQAAARIGRLIAMGGCIAEPGNVGPRSEFNLAQDPEAAEVVLAAGLDLTLIPLDVTRKVRADAGYLDRLAALATPPALAARDLIAAYFDRTSDAARPTSRPLHDPCVPVLALRPDLFGLREMRLRVDCTDDPGALVAGPHRVQVAMAVEAATVLDLLAAALA